MFEFESSASNAIEKIFSNLKLFKAIGNPSKYSDNIKISHCFSWLDNKKFLKCFCTQELLQKVFEIQLRQVVLREILTFGKMRLKLCLSLSLLTHYAPKFTFNAFPSPTQTLSEYLPIFIYDEGVQNFSHLKKIGCGEKKFKSLHFRKARKWAWEKRNFNNSRSWQEGKLEIFESHKLSILLSIQLQKKIFFSFSSFPVDSPMSFSFNFLALLAGFPLYLRWWVP